jgi:hypothetical protein
VDHRHPLEEVHEEEVKAVPEKAELSLAKIDDENNILRNLSTNTNFSTTPMTIHTTTTARNPLTRFEDLHSSSDDTGAGSACMVLGS